MRDWWRRDDLDEDGGEAYPTGTKPGATTLTQRMPVQRRALGDATPMGGAERYGEFAFVQAYGQDGARAGDARPDAWLTAASGVAGPAERLPFLDTIQPLFGHHDVSGVRSHSGPEAATASRALGAEAYAAGDAVAFGVTPTLHTAAHEAAHVVQQRGGVQLKGGMGEVGDRYEQHADAVADRVVRGESAEALLDQMTGAGGASGAPAVQRRGVQPDDVGSEMVGQKFELSDTFTTGSTTLAKGDEVIVLRWDNTKSTAFVQFSPPAKPIAQFDCPKKLMRPAHTAVAGVSEYSAGIEGQARAVEKAEDEVADWQNEKADYVAAGTLAKWEAERVRRESVAARKTAVLNTKLIQETMFNRFDDVIKREVDAANTAAGFTGKDALDPELMKSMLFQESQMGTSGEHLEDPYSVEEKSRFNIGQVIDSSGMALLAMLEKEQPAIITTFKLGSIRSDLSKAQNDLAALEKKGKKKRDATEEATFKELKRRSKQNWEIWIWEYKPSGATDGFQEAILHFYKDHAAGEPDKHLDYEFWIHMAVLWLFEKHKKGQAWPDTIRAYNGSGKRAEQYKKAVTKRAKKAAAATKAGDPFVPDKI